MTLYNLTATQASLLLKNGDISSVELTKSCLKQIEMHDKKINAFITVTGQRALARAGESDERRRRGETLGPLDGIPYAIKDNICTKDIKTTCASKMLETFIPPYSATVFERLEEKGCVFLGKLNMDEFAMGSSGETSFFQPTHNPYDSERVSGGSSAGSAASVASGECMLSLGSDTGGSIRQPAGFCGVVGLKPSYGAVSRYGLIAFASSLDQIGPLGRSVEDVELMFDAIAGYDKLDATSLSMPLTRSNHKLKDMVIGLPKECFEVDIDPEIKQSILTAATKMEKAGAKVVDVSIPNPEHALSAYYIISSAEVSSNLARFDGLKYGYRADTADPDRVYKLTRSEGFGDEVKRRILLGSYVLSAGYYDEYYKKAKQLQRQLTLEYGQILSKCDILLTPTSPTAAFKVSEKSCSPVDMYSSDIHTVIANLAGLPALSIPCGRTSLGLPIGMQLIGKYINDYALLSAGTQVEGILAESREVNLN